MFVVAAGAACVFGGVAYAASTDADVGAMVVTPITITSSTAMSFGKFTAGTGGTVAVNSSGVRSVASGNVQLLTGTGSDGAAAEFDVGGEATYTYAITLPAMPQTLVNETTEGSNMSLGTFTKSIESGTLSGTGTQSFTVGATLTVGSSQAPGTYAGMFPVSVEYN